MASLARIALLPDIPTVIESGMAGFDSSIWFGMAAPAKTPPTIIARVSRAIAEIVDFCTRHVWPVILVSALLAAAGGTYGRGISASMPT